jgi:stage V sporulation protein G
MKRKVNMMNTEVRIDRMIYREDSNLRAIASVNLNNEFAVHGIRIVSGPQGNFVSMPSVKDAQGKYYDTFHPINTDSRKELYDSILEAYEQRLSEVQTQQRQGADTQGEAAWSNPEAEQLIEESGFSEETQEDSSPRQGKTKGRKSKVPENKSAEKAPERAQPEVIAAETPQAGGPVMQM